jgi:hypothetical protein
MYPPQALLIRQGPRRAAEEIIATGQFQTNNESIDFRLSNK